MPEAIISAEGTEAPTVRSGRFTIDKEDARVTVYDRHTGGGLETVK